MSAAQVLDLSMTSWPDSQVPSSGTASASGAIRKRSGALVGAQ